MAGCLNRQAGPAGSNSNSSDNQPFSGTFQAAVALGVPLKCSYQIDDQVEAEGYIQGKQYRGQMKNPETNQVGEIIYKDNCMWAWSNETKEGSKVCFDPEEADNMFGFEAPETADISPPPNNTSPAPNVEYRCLPTVVTAATFTPPSDINFIDLDQMMNFSDSE